MTISPTPWTSMQVLSDLVHVVSAEADGTRQLVAIVDGTNPAGNAALICAAPEMRDAVLAGDLAAARAALDVRGLA